MNQTALKGSSLVDVGWGRLIFAHTFPDPQSVAKALMDEKRNQRDIAFYVNDPQLVLNEAPQDLFLDPSTTYRLNLKDWQPESRANSSLRITTIEAEQDLIDINRIYSSVGMVPVDPDTLWKGREDESYQYYVARPQDSDRIVGVTLGIDHTLCFDDLFNSCSLWALAVDPQTEYLAVGTQLIHHLLDLFSRRGRDILDLSVMQSNEAAISLYESLGFERVPVLAIKRRNQINEPLFVAQDVQKGFNPYALIIIDEALRRGIGVEPLDPPRGYFRLLHGNRRVTCRESLSDLTSSIAMCRCSDKELTAEILARADLSVPAQQVYTSEADALSFLEERHRVVVKPAQGEQGEGVSVDLRTPEEVLAAIDKASKLANKVLIEQFVEGIDLRIIVINLEVIAAAVRRPAEIIGTGRHTVKRLLEKVSRRRSEATGGESRIPLDDETERCIRDGGFTYDDILPDGQILQVRRTANLHTGGTIHDVTENLSSTLRDAARRAAVALEIPVVGLDFLVPEVDGDQYYIIEANERPGLANHEPQPTAERFIDLLFPFTLNNPT